MYIIALIVVLILVYMLFLYNKKNIQQEGFSYYTPSNCVIDLYDNYKCYPPYFFGPYFSYWSGRLPRRYRNYGSRPRYRWGW